MMSHDQRLHLRYAHTDRTRILKDVRKKRTSELACDQIYFVGFRIKGEGDGRYHHALILADDHDSFLDGIAGEFNAILGQPSVASVKDIALVFVRNLMILDPELAVSAESQNITSDIQEELIRRNDGQYRCTGWLAKNVFAWSRFKPAMHCWPWTVHAGQSWQSIRRNASLGGVPATSGTAECCALFDATAERIKPLLSCESTDSAYLH
ncbi:hypothetical protein [Candidatus Ferrigenium straubiae]|uniref:hypothetical protein n=1 Tax=Candidatus Ferrigenium straubiae TaxID=2919506 RepID=UPI003F4A9F13